MGANPFVRFVGVIQPEIVIDGLGREHHGKAFGQRLQAVEGAVAADADQAVQAQFAQAGGDHVQLLGFVGIDKIARRPDERAALGRVQFGNRLEERIEMHMRHPRIE